MGLAHLTDFCHIWQIIYVPLLYKGAKIPPA